MGLNWTERIATKSTIRPAVYARSDPQKKRRYLIWQNKTGQRSYVHISRRQFYARKLSSGLDTLKESHEKFHLWVDGQNTRLCVWRGYLLSSELFPSLPSSLANTDALMMVIWLPSWLWGLLSFFLSPSPPTHSAILRAAKGEGIKKKREKKKLGQNPAVPKDGVKQGKARWYSLLTPAN